jgi:hypothetical protein
METRILMLCVPVAGCIQLNIIKKLIEEQTSLQEEMK